MIVCVDQLKLPLIVRRPFKVHSQLLSVVMYYELTAAQFTTFSNHDCHNLIKINKEERKKRPN